MAPFYDRTVTVKESAALMALPGALVGRFLKDGEEIPGIPPSPVSRRQRARRRTAEQ
jgi:hypothetical protein